MAYEHISMPTNIFERRESRVRSYCRSFPALYKSASGSALIAEDGQRYIDFLSGCSTLNYGHNHPELKKALIEYIESDGITHGLDMHTRAKAEFLETFEKLILKPRKLDYRALFPGPTGANAVEAALKTARKVTGRTNIIAFTNGFHGMSLGALSATGNVSKRAGAGLPLSGVSHEAYAGYFGKDADTADQLDRRLSDPSSGLDKPAAIIVETTQGEGGLNVASDEWLRRIEKISRKHGALFIIDDIQAGIGRTGGFFSFERAGVYPDIVTLAKSLSGLGLPFALTLIRPQHDIWKPGEHNGTFRGNNHAFVTARRALELFWADDNFEKETARKASHLRERLEQIVSESKVALRVKGRGMMTGIEMSDGDMAAMICAECFQKGLIIETSGSDDEVIKILAPLNIPYTDLNAGLNILADAIHAAETRQKKSAA